MSDELPEGWAWARLDKLLAPEARAITDGPFGSNLKSAHYTPSGPRVIRLQNIGDGEFKREDAYISPEHFATLSKHSVEVGDLIVASLGEKLPRACLVPDWVPPAIVKADCIRVRLHPDLQKEYVNYTLQRPELRRSTATKIKGVGRPRLGMTGIRELPLPVPPLAEQERIVTAIEEHLSHLAVAEASVKSAERRLDLFRRAAVRELFDEPKWEWTTLGQIAEVKGGVTKDSKRQDDPEYTEVPYLRVANVQRGFLDLQSVATIRVTPKKAEQLALVPGDILFNEGGDRDKLGRGWVWEGQIDGCIHQNHVFRARLNDDDFDPRFVSTHGNTWGQQWFEQHGKQTTNLASLNLTTLKAFPVPAPSRLDQTTLMAKLDGLLQSERRLSDEVGSAASRAKALRRSILSAAFSGQLVPQDPDDEPASVLLERIAAERPTKPPRKKKS